MRIYLAGRYGRRQELAGCAARLRGLGHVVTSRWLEGNHEMLDESPDHEAHRQFALDDRDDLRSATTLVAFTESPGHIPNRARGGRHVELGMALERHMRVFVVGHRENVFCHLPEVTVFADFDAFMRHLIERKASTVTG